MQGPASPRVANKGLCSRAGRVKSEPMSGSVRDGEFLRISVVIRSLYYGGVCYACGAILRAGSAALSCRALEVPSRFSVFYPGMRGGCRSRIYRCAEGCRADVDASARARALRFGLSWPRIGARSAGEMLVRVALEEITGFPFPTCKPNAFLMYHCPGSSKEKRASPAASGDPWGSSGRHIRVLEADCMSRELGMMFEVDGAQHRNGRTEWGKLALDGFLKRNSGYVHEGASSKEDLHASAFGEHMLDLLFYEQFYRDRFKDEQCSRYGMEMYRLPFFQSEECEFAFAFLCNYILRVFGARDVSQEVLRRSGTRMEGGVAVPDGLSLSRYEAHSASCVCGSWRLVEACSPAKRELCAAKLSSRDLSPPGESTSSSTSASPRSACSALEVSPSSRLVDPVQSGPCDCVGGSASACHDYPATFDPGARREDTPSSPPTAPVQPGPRDCVGGSASACHDYPATFDPGARREDSPSSPPTAPVQSELRCTGFLQSEASAASRDEAGVERDEASAASRDEAGVGRDEASAASRDENSLGSSTRTAVSEVRFETRRRQGAGISKAIDRRRKTPARSNPRLGRPLPLAGAMVFRGAPLAIARPPVETARVLRTRSACEARREPAPRMARSTVALGNPGTRAALVKSAKVSWSASSELASAAPRPRTARVTRATTDLAVTLAASASSRPRKASETRSATASKSSPPRKTTTSCSRTAPATRPAALASSLPRKTPVTRSTAA